MALKTLAILNHEVPVLFEDLAAQYLVTPA
jgi:hypothetical protein